MVKLTVYSMGEGGFWREPSRRRLQQGLDCPARILVNVVAAAAAFLCLSTVGAFPGVVASPPPSGVGPPSSGGAWQTNVAAPPPSSFPSMMANQPSDTPGVSSSPTTSVVVGSPGTLAGEKRSSPSGLQVTSPETGVPSGMSVGTTRSDIPLYKESVVVRTQRKRPSRAGKIARIVGMAVALPLFLALVAYPLSKMLGAERRIDGATPNGRRLEFGDSDMFPPPGVDDFDSRGIRLPTYTPFDNKGPTPQYYGRMEPPPDYPGAPGQQ